jgi:two-component system NarL family sensor kinase
LKIIPTEISAPSDELAGLRTRLAEAEETLRAIRSGEVDVVLITAKKGVQLFTLEGAEQAYRVLIESMNEGALTISADTTVLYANQCFARMVKCPLEQVIGSFFHRFLSAGDQATLQPLLKKAASRTGSKIQVLLNAGDASQMPVQLSIRPLAKNGFNHVTIGLVVTDMTAARRSEEQLRTLTHRVVQVQEAERGRLALELHDTVTQMLCGVLIRSQTLVRKLPPGNLSAKQEAGKLGEIIRATVEEVERISRNLRPSVLDHLGLVACLHATSTEFTNRTGVLVKMHCVKLIVRLPADTELALYRIFQETLHNIEKHARASQITVHLTKTESFVQLTINDDGIGFDPERQLIRRKGKGGFGLLGMRERAAYAGGILMVKSARRAGTEIEIRIPLPSSTGMPHGG